MKTDSSRTFTILSSSLAVSIVALFGWLALALTQSKNHVLIVLVLAALVVAGIVYFVSLGILAKRTGRQLGCLGRSRYPVLPPWPYSCLLPDVAAYQHQQYMKIDVTPV